jgi:hypothetical protein
MPFTEEQVTEVATKLGESPEVVKKFLAQDEKAPEVIALLGKLKVATILPEADFNARIENEKKIAGEAGAKNGAINAHEALAKKIKAKYGIDKLTPEEHTSAYLERVIEEKLKASGGEPTAEIKRLQDELAAKETKLTELGTKLTKLESDHQTERQSNTINSRLDAAINALQFEIPAYLKDQALIDAHINNQREFVKFKLGQKYDVALVDGKEQFTDKATGQVVRDATRADIMNAKAVIDSFAPTVASLKQASSGKRGAGFKDTPLDLSKLDNAQFANYPTLKDFTDHLKASGVSLVSEEAREKMEQYQAWKAKQ